jgi:hypothetical protein
MNNPVFVNFNNKINNNNINNSDSLLDGRSEIEFLWGEIFRTRPDRPWFLPSLLYSWYRVSFPGVKRPGRGVDHHLLLAPRLQKE